MLVGVGGVSERLLEQQRIAEPVAEPSLQLGDAERIHHLAARLGRRGPSPATACRAHIIWRRASAGGAPAPRRPVARTSSGGAPRPAGPPAPRRPVARTSIYPLYVRKASVAFVP